MARRTMGQRRLTLVSRAECWANGLINRSLFHFERQYMFGYRIFDFFSEELGLVIEIDDSSHCRKCDAYKDQALLKQFGIITFRAWNFKEDQLREILMEVDSFPPLAQRQSPEMTIRWRRLRDRSVAALITVNAKKEKKKKEKFIHKGIIKGGKGTPCQAQNEKDWKNKPLRIPQVSRGGPEFRDAMKRMGFNYVTRT